MEKKNVENRSPNIFFALASHGFCSLALDMTAQKTAPFSEKRLFLCSARHAAEGIRADLPKALNSPKSLVVKAALIATN